MVVKKQQARMLVFLGLLLLPTAGAENIFDLPPELEKNPPKFVSGRNKDDGYKNPGKDEEIPNFMQVKNIPSLTQEQRRQIHNIYDQAKPEMNTMMKDMQSFNGAGQRAVPVSQEEMRQRRELREKLRARRQETWHLVKGVLNEQNLQDLELMKKGQLLPPELRQSGAPPADGFQ